MGREKNEKKKRFRKKVCIVVLSNIGSAYNTLFKHIKAQTGQLAYDLSFFFYFKKIEQDVII
jgi:hypothetical protein